MNILFFSKDLISIRAKFIMADVNATVGHLQGRLTRPLEKTTIGMCMALELKRSS
jgi:hypothetical protein